MVELKNPKGNTVTLSKPFVRGVDGATFYPEVDAAGNLTWSNDKGLENPVSVNIMGAPGIKGDTGAQGEKGERGEKGDTGAPFTYDMFTAEQLAGLKGEKGETGSQGERGEKGDKGDAFTYEDFTDEQMAALKGEKGDAGIQGERGEKGDAFTYEDFTEEQLAALKGEPGAAPVKGVDYWTAEDKQEILNELEIEAGGAALDETAVKKIVHSSYTEPMYMLAKGQFVDVYEDDINVTLFNALNQYGCVVRYNEPFVSKSIDFAGEGFRTDIIYSVGGATASPYNPSYTWIIPEGNYYMGVVAKPGELKTLYTAERLEDLQRFFKAYYTPAEVDAKLAEITEQGYVTESWVTEKITEELSKLPTYEDGNEVSY